MFSGVSTTDENGYYYFTGLEENTYQVFVWEVDNFNEGGPLYGMVNTTGEASPEQNTSNLDDNGIKGAGKVGGPHGCFITPHFRMLEGKQPLHDGDENPASDSNSNWTVDFGFYREK
ncbi:MAG: hypothetical protein HC913_20625 [Microscillaceae bacterium]|nr:hypothetical protein [Microscillaceae bacterium]